MDALQVSWLAVWNRSLAASRRGQDRHESERGPFDDKHQRSGDVPAPVMEDEQTSNNVQEDEHGDEDDESGGVLFSYCLNKAEPPEVIRRRIGLAQGLVDFSRSVSSATFDPRESRCKVSGILTRSSCSSPVQFGQ